MKYILTIIGISFLNIHLLWAQFVPPRILKHPGQIRVQRLSILNSTFRETNLCVSPDGKYLFFMSGRGQMPWSNPFYTTYKGRPEHDGDIWYSVNYGDTWQYPKCLGATINTRMGEDEPNISPDGQTVYFQSWRSNWKLTNGPYFQSTRNGTIWGRPKGLGGGITAFFKDREMKGQELATDGATMSADGKTFIVAVGPYQGNMDLFISRKNAYGQWSFCQRLGVSTLGNERSPFLSADGKTLYFASDGYGGWGGLDIFKTIINPDNSNSEVVNVGAPFNTWLDDYGFILTASGDDAFFVREGDIYYADTKDANPELKPVSATLMITGKVTHNDTKQALSANIVLRNNKTQKVIATYKSNSSTGEYAFVIPITETDFTQEFSLTGFEKEQKNFNISIKNGLNQIISDAALKPIKKPEEAVVKVDPPKKEEDKEAAADMGKDPF